MDCLISMASIAISKKYVRPTITTEKKLQIINGRHPLVETLKQFTPNTTIIDEEHNNFIHVLNAPNASGKSVYMKQVIYNEFKLFNKVSFIYIEQVASICFLAHIGCFVPADKCTISLLHSIYSRIYSPESIDQGQSSFMADLQQMSKVIMCSTDRSLILIDEFGKGTSAKDGLALLTASIDHFVERGIKTPITFITTHYNDIFKLLKSKEMICFRTINTKQNNGGVFESSFQVIEGRNLQNHFTEFPESKKILTNIFEMNVK